MPTSSTLESIEVYGSSDEAITWKFDGSPFSERTPYLALKQNQDATKLKQETFSNIWLPQSGTI